MWNPFSIFLQRSVVGIDIGTSAIKIVEVSKWGQGKTLENYGEIKLNGFSENKKEEYYNGKLSIDFSAQIIKGIIREAKIKTKSVVFAVPDFLTFCASFDLPPMTEKEIPEAVRYNASRYITMPISEVMLDWKVIKKKDDNSKNSQIKIFLIVIPNQVIQEFQSIAKLAGLKICALEAEALSVARALVKSDEKTVCVADIGVQSSTVNIVDEGFLKKSYSFNFNGNQIYKAIAGATGIDRRRLAKVYGSEDQILARPDIAKTLSLLLDPLLFEIKGISHEFFKSEGKEVQEIYLTGGASNLPGIKEYFSRSLQKNVTVPNCFSDFIYAPILEKTLKEMSPRFTVAVGAALGGLEG